MVSPLMLTTNLYYMYYSHKWRMCGMWFYVSLITNCLTLKAFCCQWSSQGAVVAVVPLLPDSDKNYCCISSSYYILITFFLREALCGLEYAENAFAAGASPRITLGELTMPPDSLVGWGGDTPPQTPPDSAQAPPPSRIWRSGLPATDNFWLLNNLFYVAIHQKSARTFN